MWECPECHKEFARQNQSHQCAIVPVDALFSGKKAAWKPVYEMLLQRIAGIGNFKITTSAKAITLYAASRFAFMGVVVKANGLDLWFALGERIDEFPVYKIVQPSANRFGHFVRITEPADIDPLLVRWLQQSYDFINSK